MVAVGIRPALGAVEVVPFARRHLRQVLAIEERVYPRPWGPALFASELAQRDTRRYLVARAGTAGGSPRRRVVGYGGVMIAVGEAHITTLAVHPDEHRRKIGSRLLLALLRTAVQRGASAATLEVRAANLGAQRLYAAFGFAPVAVRPRYYAETEEDALIMWIHDLDAPRSLARLDEVAASLDQPGGSRERADLHVPWVRGRVGLDGVRRDTGAASDAAEAGS